jgi:hypothetical protein
MGLRRLLAIDPGSARSAWLAFDEVPIAFGILPNEELLRALRVGRLFVADRVVIEQIESYGMAVGREVFDTVHWSGRFAESVHPTPVDQLTRRAVKLHLCGSPRAKDPNIRQALLDRFGGKTAAIGTKRAPGPLYGIHADLWAALAVAVTWADGVR